MNCVNFNVSTPNVNYARLSDESTNKPIEQVNFKCKYLRYRKNGLKKLEKQLNIIDSANIQYFSMLNENKPLAEQKEIAIRDSVGQFFKNIGNLFKNFGKKNKKVSRNQKAADFKSDAANYFDYKKRGRNLEAKVYKKRMRRFSEEN